MAGRTNFVSVTNLPLGFSNGQELNSLMNNCGPVQDMTAVDPTTVIVSYGIRSALRDVTVMYTELKHET